MHFGYPRFADLYPVAKRPSFTRVHVDCVPRMGVMRDGDLGLCLFDFHGRKTFRRSYMGVVVGSLVGLVGPGCVRIAKVFAPHKNVSVCPCTGCNHPKAGFRRVTRRQLVGQRWWGELIGR